jgi:hypothetical protein
MRSKTLISTIALSAVLAASITPAHADRGHRHGHGNRGDNGAAIVAGVLGALVVGSLIANASAPDYRLAPVYIPPAPTYYQPPPQYWQPAPPQAYVPAQPAVVSDDGYGYRWRERSYQPYYGY